LVEPCLLIANSHVSGRSFVVENAQVRVLCNNTLTLTLADGVQGSPVAPNPVMWHEMKVLY
jgi:hypothetical protein